MNKAQTFRLLRFLLAITLGTLLLSVSPQLSIAVSTAVLLYTYVGYPLLLAVLAAFRRASGAAGAYTPGVSILIAAHNEEADIERTIRDRLLLEYPEDKLEVVVVSDGSTDGTNEILRGIQHPRFRYLLLDRQRGKTVAQNHGVELCAGEIIVFSDATTLYQRDAIRWLVRHYADPTVGGVSGRYKYTDGKTASPTATGSAAFWNYENVIKWLQSTIYTMTGCSGCIYSVRKSLYTPLSPKSCSDLVEPLCIVRQGYRVVFEQNALAYEMATESIPEEFRMRVRVAANGIEGILESRDLLNISKHHWVAFQLISHKVLRWMAPLFLINLLLMSALLIDRPVFAAMFAAQGLFYLAGVLLARAPVTRRWKLLGLPSYFCTLNAAVVMAVLSLAMGRDYSFWRPVRH